MRCLIGLYFDTCVIAIYLFLLDKLFFSNSKERKWTDVLFPHLFFVYAFFDG